MSEMPHYDNLPRMEVTAEKAAEIEAKLNAIASDEPYVPPLPVADETPEVVIETTPTIVEAAVEETPPVTDEPGSPPEPADQTAKPDAPTLPDNIRRSLIATGWDDEEIDNNLSVLGDEFLPIASRVHQKRMDESSQWAARGRAVRESEPENTATEEVSEKLSSMDVEGLKAEYGHDPAMSDLIDKMSGKMNASIEAINQILPIISEQRAHQKEATDAAIKDQVDAFFDSSGLVSYDGFYGKGNMDAVEDKFYDNRMLVCQQADALQVGAAEQGRTVSMAEALGMAHDMVSGDFQMEALRADIKSKMQQRAASITLKPDASGGDTTPAVGEVAAERPQKSRAQMEADAKVALQKLFG